MKRATDHGGVLLVDKPSGPTSFDVVRWVRRALQIKKVGHTGTLDPLASGLLVVCVGEATKLVPFLMEGKKQYRALIALGSRTNTDDREGQVTSTAPVPEMSWASVESTLKSFVGGIMQVPPAFAAIKKDGEPLYVKARRGEEVEVDPRPVTIYNINLEQLGTDSMTIEVTCGKGTYIRSLARDIGLALGTQAHLGELRRLANSGYFVDGKQTITGSPDWAADDLRGSMIAPTDAVSGLPVFRLDAENHIAVNCGQAVTIERDSQNDLNDGQLVRLADQDGYLTAIARSVDGKLQPVRVFARH